MQRADFPVAIHGPSSMEPDSTPTNTPRPEADGAPATMRGVPGGLLVAVIALLVVLVSLPRFHAHTLDANRADARITLDVLGAEVFSSDLAGELGLADGPDVLIQLVRATPALAHRFPDARMANDAGQFLHHGYRVDTGFVLEGIRSWPAIVTWPDRFTESGDAAFALTRDGRLFGHPNGGLWSGGQSALRTVDLSDEGWALLRPARTE